MVGLSECNGEGIRDIGWIEVGINVGSEIVGWGVSDEVGISVVKIVGAVEDSKDGW